MRVSLKEVCFVAVTLLGIGLVSCSDAPPDDLVRELILQSQPDIGDVEIIHIGEYDEETNRAIVRARYVWTPHALMREECVSDFLFFKDMGTDEWRLAPSTINVSRKIIP